MGLDEKARFVSDTSFISEKGAFFFSNSLLSEKGTFFSFHVPPLTYSMSLADYLSHTPFTVLRSLDARGKVPVSIMSAFDPTYPYYHFQKQFGVTRLTVTPQHSLNNRPNCLAQWPKMASAVAAWQALSPSQKATWNNHPDTQTRNLPGYNVFISHHLRGLI